MVNNLLSAIIKDVVEKRKITYLLARWEKSVNENKFLAGKGTAPGLSLWEIYAFLKKFLLLS